MFSIARRNVITRRSLLISPRPHGIKRGYLAVRQCASDRVCRIHGTSRTLTSGPTLDAPTHVAAATLHTSGAGREVARPMSDEKRHAMP